MKPVSLRFLAVTAFATCAFAMAGCTSTLTRTAQADPCDVAHWTAANLYGTWTIDLPDRQQHGVMVLSSHPDYPGSLRAEITYAGLHAMGSGDVGDGILNLDESRDDKNIYAYWDGALDPATCGTTIRGTWEQAVPQGAPDVKTPFVLQRAGAAPKG